MNYAEVWPLTSSPHFQVFCLSVFPEMLLTHATKWDQYRTLPEIQCRASEPAFLHSDQHLMYTLLWNHWMWPLTILFHRTDSNQPHHNIPRLRFFKQFYCAEQHLSPNGAVCCGCSDGTASSPSLCVRSSFLKRANLNRSGPGTFTPYCRVSDLFMKYNSSFSPSHKV